jgi:tRNA pseudouridine55 synthase
METVFMVTPAVGDPVGFIGVNKPAGMTSHDVVDAVRRRFRCKKVGHGGTLDPFAEGVLVLGIGRGATKQLSSVVEHEKEYDALMHLGVTTDTGDATGKVMERREWRDVALPDVQKALERFRGEYAQVPPMYSALKRGGTPLYKLARKGMEVPREPRRVRIYDIRLGSLQLPNVRFSVTCSKGTYIRTLCTDLGELLGCGAHLETLVRTRVGPFDLSGAVRLDDLFALNRDEFVRSLVAEV